MTVYIETGGTLEFTFGGPNSLGFNTQAGYFDWSMFPANATCSDIISDSVSPIRCNWNRSDVGGTGLLDILTSPIMDPGNYEPSLVVNTGDLFYICFSNYDDVQSIVPLQFGGTAVVSCIPPLAPFSSVNLSFNDTFNFETCNLLELNITRIDSSNMFDSLKIYLEYFGTAVNGVDYSNSFIALPDSIYLLPNQYDSTFVITIDFDNINEINEIAQIIYYTNGNDRDTVSFVISDSLYMYLELGSDTTINQGESVILSPIINDIYGLATQIEWTESGDFNTIGVNTQIRPKVSPDETTIYYFTIYDKYGCLTIDSITIFVIDLPFPLPFPCIFSVPSAFTPDGDGINDVWHINCIEEEVDASVKVYSRWGGLVYESKGGITHAAWDGRGMNGGDLPVGTYYFILEGWSDETINGKGIITLIR